MHLARHSLPDVRDRLQFGDHQCSPFVPPGEQCWLVGCLTKKKPGESRKIRQKSGNPKLHQHLAIFATFIVDKRARFLHPSNFFVVMNHTTYLTGRVPNNVN